MGSDICDVHLGRYLFVIIVFFLLSVCSSSSILWLIIGISHALLSVCFRLCCSTCCKKHNLSTLPLKFPFPLSRIYYTSLVPINKSVQTSIVSWLNCHFLSYWKLFYFTVMNHLRLNDSSFISWKTAIQSF